MFRKHPPRPELPEPHQPEPTPDPGRQIELARQAFDAGELGHPAAHTENALFPGPTVTLPEIHEMLARLAGHPQGGSRLFPLEEPYAANRIVARAHVLAHERRFDEALLLLKMVQEFAPEVPWADVLWVTNPGTAAAVDPKVVANVALDLMPVLRAARDLDGLRPAMEPYRVLVRHATSAHPENANLHGAAAYFVRRLDAAEAVGYAERADQLKPGTASAEVLGLAYRDTGRTDDAIAAFERGVAYDPKLLTMYCNLVDLLFKADRHDEALSYAQRALTVSPGYACGQAAVHAIRFSQTRQASDFDALLKLYKAQQTDPETQGHIGQLVHLASQKSGAETVTISGTPDEVLRQTRKFLKRNRSLRSQARLAAAAGTRPLGSGGDNAGTARKGAAERRLHCCTLFASLSRYDVSIVNPHIWGEPATANLAANDEAGAAAWFTADDLTRLGIHPTR